MSTKGQQQLGIVILLCLSTNLWQHTHILTHTGAHTPLSLSIPLLSRQTNFLAVINVFAAAEVTVKVLLLLLLFATLYDCHAPLPLPLLSFHMPCHACFYASSLPSPLYEYFVSSSFLLTVYIFHLVFLPRPLLPQMSSVACQCGRVENARNALRRQEIFM